MKILKKIQDLLFEKEEVEPVTLKEQVVEPPVIKTVKSIDEKPKEPLKPVEVKKEPVKVLKEEVKIEKAKEPIRNIYIDVDETPKVDKKKKEVKDVKNIEYEFSRPISPIFGIKEEEEPKHSQKNVPTTHKINKNVSKLGTVLSPIYGDAIDEIVIEKEPVIKENISTDYEDTNVVEENNETHFDDEIHQDNIVENETNTFNGDFENISIDDILNEQKEENKIDNISLFEEEK